MSEEAFRLIGELRVDGSQAVEELGRAEDALDKIGGAEKRKTAAEREAEKAAREHTAAVKQLREWLDPAAAAQDRLNKQLAVAKTEYDAGRLSAQEYALAQQRAEAATKGAVAASAMQRAGMQQLGMQFGDFTQQLSLGINPMIAFGQQAGQAAYAASMMGGKVGEVGAFFAGPWGAIILAATTVLGTQLIPKLFGAGEAADSLKQKQVDLGEFFDRTTGKIKAQITQLQLLGLANRKAIDADKLRSEIVDAREELSNNLSNRSNLLARQIGGTAQESAARRAVAQQIVDANMRFRRDGDGTALARTLQQIAAADPAFKSFARTNITLATTIGDSTQRLREAEAAQRVATGTASLADKVLAGVVTTQGLASRATQELAAKRRDAAGAEARYALEVEKLQEALAKNLDEAAFTRGLQAAQDRRDAEIASIRAVDAARRRSTADQKREAEETKKYREGLNRQEAADLRKMQDELAKSLDLSEADRTRLYSGVSEKVAEGIRDGANVGWGDFEARGAVAITAIGQAIAGKIGGAIERVGAVLQGIDTGNFTALGGRGGGLLSLAGIGGKPKGGVGFYEKPIMTSKVGGVEMALPGLSRYELGKAGIGSPGDIFQASFSDTFKAPFKKLGDKLDGLFGDKAGSFASTAGKAFAGAAQGSIASGVAGALGIKQSGVGAQLGGAIGSMFGPFGGMIGGLLGGTLGGVFMKTKTGSATVSSSGGSISTGSAVGNSAAFRKASEAMGGSVGDAIQAIVDQLGGEIGSFAVSVGRRGKKFTVDGSGSDRTKGAGVEKFASEQEAIQAALANALRDGAVANVSPRVQAVLQQYADNINKAVSEALNVKALEDLVANDKNPFTTLFRDFDFQAKRRIDIARRSGMDIVDIERINGEQRAQLIKDTLSRATASISALLEELRFGDKAAGSDADKRRAAIAERDSLLGAARRGDQGAIDKVVALSSRILELDRTVLGTGDAAAASRSATVSLVEELKRLVEDRVNAAASAAGNDATIGDAVEQLDETNDQLAALGVDMAAARAALEKLASGSTDAVLAARSISSGVLDGGSGLSLRGTGGERLL